MIDTASNTIVETLRVGEEFHALVYVEGAIPEGEAGSANPTRQGLDKRVGNLPFEIRGADEAKGSANIGSLNGLEVIDIAVRGLPAEQTLTVFAPIGEASI